MSIRKIFHSTSITFPLFLLAINILAYGLLIPRLGFYSDDWTFIYAYNKIGPMGITQYFSTNRPFWGWLFQVTLPLIGAIPWKWQVFALILRWLTGISVWILLKNLWPKQSILAIWTATLLTIYPGFVSQSVSVTYSHIFIVYLCFIFSFVLTIKSINQPKYRWIYTFLAIILSIVNLLTMEFFYMLELLRPFLIWFTIQNEFPGSKIRWKKFFSFWIPYLIVFIGVSFWRILFFKFQDYTHPAILLDQLHTDPAQTLLHLPEKILNNIYISSVLAWVRPFLLGDLQYLGNSAKLLYLILVLGAFATCLSYFLFLLKNEGFTEKYSKLVQPIIFGVCTILLAGIPFVITGLVPNLWDNSSRFTLPFMIGSCVILVSFFLILPIRHNIKITLFSLLVAFSVGVQFVASYGFQIDWKKQNQFFSQLISRAPGLEPGTLIIANDTPMGMHSYSGLTFALNWIYSQKTHHQTLDYALVFGTENQGLLNPDKTRLNFLSSGFNIDNKKILFVYFDQNCLQVLDPQYEYEYPTLDSRLDKYAGVSNPSVVVGGQGRIGHLNLDIIKSPNAVGFCERYNQADLARQQGDWKNVLNIFNNAVGDSPNKAVYLFPLIQAYAKLGSWSSVISSLEKALSMLDLYPSRFEDLWNKIAENAPDTPEKAEARNLWYELLNQYKNK
jgi:hypothetical protein